MGLLETCWSRNLEGALQAHNVTGMSLPSTDHAGTIQTVKASACVAVAAIAAIAVAATAGIAATSRIAANVQSTKPYICHRRTHISKGNRSSHTCNSHQRQDKVKLCTGVAFTWPSTCLLLPAMMAMPAAPPIANAAMLIFLPPC